MCVAVQLHAYNKNLEIKPVTEFSSGSPIVIDDVERIKTRAADGDLQAAYLLGVAYETGVGLSADNQSAVTWLKRAADAGYAPAINRLGLSEWNATFGERDEQRALALFRQASQFGNVDATNNLAIMLAHGWGGTERDEQTAATMLEDAASRGCVAAAYNAGVLAETGAHPDLEKAFNFYSRGAEGGDANAMLALSLLYWEGKGTSVDKPASINLLRKAADAGISDAVWLLGSRYQWGEGVSLDSERAFQLYEKASNMGNSMGQFHLGCAYEFGTGTSKSVAAAVETFEKCAARKVPSCMINLADLYEEEVPKNPSRAWALLTEAADMNVPTAIHNLALHYFQGRLVRKDDKKALETIRRLDPKSQYKFYYETLGYILDMSDDPAVVNLVEAISILEEGSTLYPKDSRMLLYLSDAYIKHGDSGKALTTLEKMEEMNADNADNLALAAEGYALLHLTKRAVALAQRAEDLNSGRNPSITESLAYTLEHDGRYDESLAVREKIVATHPENARYLNSLAWELATVKQPELRDPQRALVLITKALSIAGDDPGYIDTLAETYFVQGEVAKAIETEKRAIALAPNNKGFQETLARYQAANK